jgi:hypothetical protein
MNRKSFLLALAAVAGFAFGMGQAQAKPNFTGDWKLNVEKSNFGPMPGPDKMTMKVDHKEPELSVHTAQSGAQGDMENDVKYTTDGKETKNTLNTPGGQVDAKSTAVWEGDSLLITTKVEANGQEIVIKSTYTLSEDGKTMTNVAKIATPQGELEMTYVMNKQ